MGLNCIQFRDDIIIPVLEKLAKAIHPLYYSEDAVNLMLGTACAESHLTYLKQLNGGTALGLYQMESKTYYDIIEWIGTKSKASRREAYREVIMNNGECFYLPHKELIYDLKLQTIFTRLYYWRIPEPIPSATPLQAQYWKRYYNTAKGKGTMQHYINAFPDLS